jgi:Flp pilus assembly pilin Flp
VASIKKKLNRIRGAAPVIEYIVLVVVIIAALASMSEYIRRAVSGRWREVGDVFGFGRQYEPGRTIIERIR